MLRIRNIAHEFIETLKDIIAILSTRLIYLIAFTSLIMPVNMFCIMFFSTMYGILGAIGGALLANFWVIVLWIRELIRIVRIPKTSGIEIPQETIDKAFDKIQKELAKSKKI